MFYYYEMLTFLYPLLYRLVSNTTCTYSYAHSRYQELTVTLYMYFTMAINMYEYNHYIHVHVNVFIHFLNDITVHVYPFLEWYGHNMYIRSHFFPNMYIIMYMYISVFDKLISRIIDPKSFLFGTAHFSLWANGTVNYIVTNGVNS